MEKQADRAPEIDAVALTRRIRDAQHEALEGKPWEERAAFFRAKADALHREIERSRKRPVA